MTGRGPQEAATHRSGIAADALPGQNAGAGLQESYQNNLHNSQHGDGGDSSMHLAIEPNFIRQSKQDDKPHAQNGWKGDQKPFLAMNSNQALRTVTMRTITMSSIDFVESRVPGSAQKRALKIGAVLTYAGAL